MKKTTFIFLIMFLLGIFNLRAVSGVDPATAWFNNETFEKFTLGADLKTASDSAYSDWVGTNVMAGIQQLASKPATSSAANYIFGFPTGTTLPTAFADGTSSGTLNISKAAFKGGALTGYVYVKTAFFFQTYGCAYSLKNTNGDEVFKFGGINNNAGAAMYCTGLANTAVTLGNRGNWGDVECVLDLNNKLIKKVTFTYVGGTGSPKTWSDIALTNGTDVKSLYLTVSRRSGLDNTTIGQLVPDNFQNLVSSQDSHQTLENTAVTTTLNVTPISTAMGLTLPFTGSTKNVDIRWSVSNWGGMNEVDKLLVSLTRKAEDYTTAELVTSGAISADADIVLTAMLPDSTTLLTKMISLKSGNMESVKNSLNFQITSANSVRDAVTDTNPYISSLKSSLNTVLSTGNYVFLSVSSTFAEVIDATNNVKTAKTVFEEGMVPFNSFKAFISGVVSAKDTVAVSVPENAFFPAIKSSLSNAVAVALTSKDTVSSVMAIDNARTMLNAAFLQFNADRPAYYALSANIAATQLEYNRVLPRKGDQKFMQYHTVQVDSLLLQMDSANNKLILSSTAHQLDTAKTVLSQALAKFAASKRVLPTENYYRIFTYGSSGGDGSEMKKVLSLHKTDSVTVSLVWCSIADTKVVNVGDSALWSLIPGTANNAFAIKNKATGKYLNGASAVADSLECFLFDAKSQSGYLNGFLDWSTRQFADPNFLYSIKNAAGSALEVRTQDFTPFGIFRTGGYADRYRFAFQLEENLPAHVSTTSDLSQEFICKAEDSDTVTVIISGENLFNSNIALSLEGTDAKLFKISDSIFTTLNNYVVNKEVKIIYSPVKAEVVNSAALRVSTQGGDSLLFNLKGSSVISGFVNSKLEKAYSLNGNLYFNAVSGEKYEIFNTLGMKILSGISKEGLNMIALPFKGMIILRKDSQSVKIIM